MSIPTYLPEFDRPLEVTQTTTIFSVGPLYPAEGSTPEPGVGGTIGLRYRRRHERVFYGLESLGSGPDVEPASFDQAPLVAVVAATYDAVADLHWLELAASLEGRGRKHAALDLVYDTVDRWLCDGQFRRCNLIFETVRPDGLSAELILGLLTVTRSAAGRLESRSAFGECARVVLSVREGDADQLLAGLL